MFYTHFLSCCKLINYERCRMLKIMQRTRLQKLWKVSLIIMVALCNRPDHYIFILILSSSFFFFFSFFPCLISAVGDWCLPYFGTWCGLSANLECRSEMRSRLAANTGRKKVAKNRHLATIAQLCRAISSQLRHVSTIGKNLLSSNTSSTCHDNMVNFGPLTAEICWRVWGTPGNFNGFRILAALLHGTLAVGASQTLGRWTEGATYVRQGDHQAGHWPTF